MGCGMGMIKYLLFIFNFIFALCGLAILAVGVIVHLQVKSLADSVENTFVFPSITLIVLGSIIFVISFFGCCGAIRESHCMTITFACFLLTILIVQVAVAVYVFINIKNSDDISITKGYQEFFNSYWKNDAHRETIDAVQVSLKCCGVKSYHDFEVNNSNFNGTIPWSCCENKELQPCTDISAVHNVGCGEKVNELLGYAGTILAGLAIGVAAVELIGIIFALCLANSIKNTERRGYRV